jgi:hypothetical protein
VIGGSLAEAKYKYRNPSEIPVSPGGEIEDEAIDHTHVSEKPNIRSVK